MLQVLFYLTLSFPHIYFAKPDTRRWLDGRSLREFVYLERSRLLYRDVALSTYKLTIKTWPINKVIIIDFPTSTDYLGVVVAIANPRAVVATDEAD
jgi:hypothetical protein